MSFPQDFDLAKINESFLNSIENSPLDSDSLYNIFNQTLRNEKYWSSVPLDLKQRMVRIVEYRIGKEGFSNNVDSVFSITKDLFQSKLDHVVSPEILGFIRGEKKLYELSNEDLMSILSLSRIFKIENLDMIAHLNSIPFSQINEENLSTLLEAAKNYKSMYLLKACCYFLNKESGIHSPIVFAISDSGDLAVSLFAGRELILDEGKYNNAINLEEMFLAYENPFLIKDTLKAFEIISEKYLGQVREKPEIQLNLDITIYLKENAEVVNEFLDKYSNSVTSLKINNTKINKIAIEFYGSFLKRYDSTRAEARKELAYPISNIDILKNLKTLSIQDCIKIENLDFKELKNLKNIEFDGGSILNEEGDQNWLLDAIAYPEQIEKLIATNRNQENCEKISSFKNLKTLHLSGTLNSLTTSAENVTVKFCSQLKVLNAPEAKTLIIQYSALEELTTPAENVTLEDCWELKVLNTPNVKTLTINGVTLKKLTTSAENLTLNNCIYLNEVEASSAKIVHLMNCSIDKINIPKVKTLEVRSGSLPEELTISAEKINLSYCNKLKTLKAPNVKEIELEDCNSVEELEIPRAEKVFLNYNANLKALDVNAVDVELKNCEGLEILTAPIAENVNLSHCNKLKTVRTPNAKEINLISCMSVEELEIPRAEKVLLFTNKKLKALDVNAVDVELKNCEGLEIIEAPNAEKLIIVNAPKLETVKAPLAQEGCIEKCLSINEIEVLFALPEYLVSIIALSRLLKPYEIISIKSETEVESAIPEVPELQLKTDGIEIKDFQMLEQLTDQLMAIDESLRSLKCGGDVYTKDDLEEVIAQILSFLGDLNQDLNLRKKIYFLLSEFTEKLTANLDKSGLIRLCADYRNGDVTQMEKTLELLYRLESMNSMFHEINFDKPDEKGYISPETLKNELKSDRMESVTLEELTQSFEALLDRIKRQERYLGTPPENVDNGHIQLKKYYHNLEQYFQLVTIGLEKEDDMEDRASHLIDIAIASLHCGERWMGDSQQIYSFITESNGSATETTIEELIKKADTKFKLGIIEKLSYNQFNMINVHMYDQYKRLIGMELGIPGSEAFVDVEDLFADPSLTKEIALENFGVEYSLRNIVEFQKGQLEEFFERNVRDALITYLIQNMPAEWIETEYGDVLNGLNSLIERKAERDDIRAFLKSEGIIIRSDWSADNALNVYIQGMQDSADFIDLEEQDREIRLNEMEKLRGELKNLTIDEQKILLRKKEIPLGREYNPNFKAELFLNYINPDYLESIFIKNKESGEPTKQLNLQAVLPVLLLLLEKTGKIRKKSSAVTSINNF